MADAAPPAGGSLDSPSVAEVIGGSGLSAFKVFDVLHRLVRRGLVQAVTGDAPAP